MVQYMPSGRVLGGWVWLAVIVQPSKMSADNSARSNNVTGFVADDVGDVSVSSPTFFVDFYVSVRLCRPTKSASANTRYHAEIGFFFVSSQRFSTAD